MRRSRWIPILAAILAAMLTLSLGLAGMPAGPISSLMRLTAYDQCKLAAEILIASALTLEAIAHWNKAKEESQRTNSDFFVCCMLLTAALFVVSAISMELLAHSTANHTTMA